MNPTRLQRSMRATLVGLVTNALLAVGKLIAGILGNSYALIADAIESFSDIASSLIVLNGVIIADRPADANHPYGHGKAETIAAAGVAVMLLAAAIGIFVQALRGITAPRHAPAVFTLVVVIGVVVIKEGLFRFVNRVGAELDSAVVRTDAWHHRSDAITSAAAALGIGIALVGGPRFAVADNWAAMFAAAVVGWNGIRLLKPAVYELTDAAPQDDVADQARAVAVSVPGVQGVEKCFARKMGYGYILDMHVEVDSAMTVANAHAISHAVEDSIRARLPRVNEVTVHIEPHPHPGARPAPGAPP